MVFNLLLLPHLGSYNWLLALSELDVLVNLAEGAEYLKVCQHSVFKYDVKIENDYASCCGTSDPFVPIQWS